MIRRSRLEVFMDIMKVVAEEREAKRTRIMYRANLAWNVLKDSLESMEKKGIVESKETPAGVVVVPTSDGLELLDKYCSVEQVFAKANPQAEGLLYPTTRMTLMA